jgi:uncharacterized protein YbgA (DUF1722 family)/uncharacterized protein YbbK (DUF523 family)
MRKFEKPVIFSSKCLGFAHCRYNGLTIESQFVNMLRPHVEFITACPEVEIGLGVPREPIRLVKIKDGLRLIQPATGLDCTEKMTDFGTKFLSSIGEVDGFILKNRSPSCGIKEVKVYPAVEKAAVIGKTAGFFGDLVLKQFSHLPVEDEARINDFRIRENFFTRIFLNADFRRVKKSGSMRELVRFHSDNKFIIMAYHQGQLKKLGQIAANHENRPVNEVIKLYGRELYKATSKIPRYTSNINVLMHALGYFSGKLQSAEKKYFLETLGRYRESKLPLSVPISIIRSFIVRFGEPYLSRQSFFEPFPEDLVTVTDSGKGRERKI